jgi:hypothetical protein
MKVSFTLGSGEDIRVNNVASRILTENLTRNPNFDVTFLNYTITSSLNIDKKFSEYIPIMKQQHRIFNEHSLWYNFFKVVYSNYHHVDFLIQELKTEYLFYNCSSLQIEFYHVAQILNHGVKIIIGGSLTNTYSFKEIRDIISPLVSDQRYMKNLLIVKGYVDLTTDLYSVVQKWRDVEITENDFSTFWECEQDYTIEKIKRLKKFNIGFDNFYPFAYSIFMLDNKCWWNKCRFCTYPFFKRKDFTIGSSSKKISNNIINTLRRYDNDSIFLANDYFQFTHKYKEILENLVSEGIKIVIFTGMQSLKNEKYIDDINKYVHAVKLGLESLDTFGLSYANKGYTYNDVKYILKLIKDNMKRDVHFLTNLIIDLPTKSKDNIIRNYERAWQFKKEMIDAGFNFNYSSKLISVSKDTRNVFIDNKYITINESNENISGRYFLFDAFRKAGIMNDDMYKTMSLPLLRFDENGNELSTDFDYIDMDLAKKVFKWRNYGED